ncbi:MAG: RNA pseudouridine synthase [Puniceicoccales bacterium]|jgi:23S rRNA-/tRNA-specific pseudouridylate synthase|nr:RNA pseudouridine synthase [Puniceicoccales bacterium]
MDPSSILPLLQGGVSLIGCDKNGLVALEKPCGILSHPNGRSSCDRALIACPYSGSEGAYVCENGSKIFLLNRLDSPVSGVLLIGLSRTVADAVKFAFKCRNVFKRYVALSKGFPRSKSGMWSCGLRKFSDGKSIKMSAGPGMFARTRYETVTSFRSRGVTLSALNLFPITGRTHQLRIHCAMNGLPIIGDETYGDSQFNRTFREIFKNDRLFLHSAEISLTYAIGGCKFNFQAASCEDFSESLECFRR